MKELYSGEKMSKNHQCPSNIASEATPLNYQYHSFSKLRILKNLLILSLAFLTLCDAYDGLLLFQSTLNGDEAIGVLSVAIQFGCGCIISLFFPKYLIRKLGSQKVMLISMLMFIPYIVANFYPYWIFMLPASILVGSWYPLLFAALCTYLNDLSILYTEHIRMAKSDWNGTVPQYAYDNEAFSYNDTRSCSDLTKDESKLVNSTIDNFSEPFTYNCFKCNCCSTDEQYSSKNIRSSLSVPKTEYDQRSGDPKALINNNATAMILESTTAQFFGFHGMVYQSGHVWTNLMSYYVLRSPTVKNEHSLNSTCLCGASFCADYTECYENNVQAPTSEMRNILISVFLALGIFSVLLIALFLDKVENEKEDISLSLEVLMATFKQMKNINQLCVIPLTVYIGIIEGFLMCDYPQAYVACAWGIHQIGLVAAVFSVTLALASSVSASFVKFIGRLSIFLFTAALNVAMSMVLLLWIPDSERPVMIFVVGGIIGVVTGIYWTQLRAFYGILFKGDEEAGFANYQLWRSIGSCLAFAYSSYLCTAIKVYLLLAFSTLGIIGIVFAEFNHARNERKE